MEGTGTMTLMFKLMALVGCGVGALYWIEQLLNRHLS